jgi:biotin carboxyl carrier protein
LLGLALALNLLLGRVAASQQAENQGSGHQERQGSRVAAGRILHGGDDAIAPALLRGLIHLAPGPTLGKRHSKKLKGKAMPSVDIKAEVTGKVWKIETQPGDSIGAGDVVMILESMKMEIPVEAPKAGKLAALLVAEGDSVKEGQALARLEV